MEKNTLTYEEQLLELLNEAIERCDFSDKQKEKWWQHFNQFSDAQENREVIIFTIMTVLERVTCIEEAAENP